ncbi:Uncharacterized conserved protein [Modicisalibacter muralis]|uniref:Uncharacterized conserved protein n=1 Tax=Modicisalibacter muralis TaxID=119000 RepID=A0A1G9FH05_9GAMM|nr:exopolysaccharide biosynthesis protein [Halomonas muralis]SDK87668.1 Uncharacterized conserved protein [Halomonas muralis]
MNDDPQFTTLEQLIVRLREAAQGADRVSLRAIIETVGSRSFGPLLLIAGLVTLMPIIGDIPGVPTVMAVVVLLTSIQLLLHRQYFWLPGWLLNRSISRKTFVKALQWSLSPAHSIDRLLRPRLVFLTRRAGIYFIAVMCIVIAAAMPPMEVVPFSATGAGAALSAFGLSLIAQDGLLALLAFALTAGTLGFVGYQLL